MISFLAFLDLKLWLKNQILIKNQVRQKVTLAIVAEGHNSPAHWAGELFKHFKDVESLVVSI